jgi:predicted Fe-Mo cluster-binding NifX family protein
MKVAVSVWGHFVSTVFDFCDHLLIVNTESGRIKDRTTVHFTENTIIAKAARLRKIGVQTLLCGAISRPLERMIVASGIVVIPFLSGTADEILEAYLTGDLIDGRFALPGCRTAGWHCRRRGMRSRGRRGGQENMKKRG